MAELIVQRVANRRQRREFLDFPWKLYRDDPYWIPPLLDSQKELLGYRRHPFYQRNAVQTFLAYRGGEVCGRIAAILNQGHNDRYHERRGFFGFFECVDDQEAADGLLDAVRQWFADQGIFRLRGPANPSLNYETGLLVDGFDSSPVFMMTYNPPYYGAAAGELRLPQDPGHVRLLGAHQHAAEDSREALADRRADPSSGTTSACGRWTRRGSRRRSRPSCRSTTAR